jgi:hypothetical protein
VKSDAVWKIKYKQHNYMNTVAHVGGGALGVLSLSHRLPHNYERESVISWLINKIEVNEILFKCKPKAFE